MQHDHHRRDALRAALLASLQRETHMRAAIAHHNQQIAICAAFSNTTRNLPNHIGRRSMGGQRISVHWLKRLPMRDCLARFRYYAEEIIRLLKVLDIPDPFVTTSRSKFTSLEALCLLLARFVSISNLDELSAQYNRPIGAISEAINELSQHLDERWHHLLDFDTNGLLTPDSFERWSTAIREAGSPVPSLWGFLDCTLRRNCRLSWLQQLMYNGYKKFHCTKYQVVRTPDGMFAHVFGPELGRHNDNHLLAQSGLLGHCAEHAIQPGSTPDSPLHERFYQLLGDKAYPLSPQLISLISGDDLTEEQSEWNHMMSSFRIEVEHGFADVIRLWPYLNVWWKHRVFYSPVGRYYRVGVLFTNAHNCIRPNQTSQFFHCEPPTLEEYFV